MTQNKRSFMASFSVKVGTTRTKFELADAQLFGGDVGKYRVRVNRRWYDNADGKLLLLDALQVSQLATKFALGLDLQIPEKPNFQSKQIVIVPLEVDEYGARIRVTQGRTMTGPILTYEGQWQIAVNTYEHGTKFYNCEDVRKA